MSIITQGYGEDQMIITKGYGQVAIIIPIVTIKGRRKRIQPTIIYVDKKYALDMQQFNIFQPIFLELKVDSFSYLKEEISRAKLKGLKLVYYKEFFAELKKSNIVFNASFSLLLSQISKLIEDEVELNVDSFKTLCENNSILVLNIEELKKELRKKIKASKAINKIALFDKLDKLDEI